MKCKEWKTSQKVSIEKEVALSKQKRNWNLKSQKKSFSEMKNCRQFSRLFCEFVYIFFLKNDLNIFYEIEFFRVCYFWMEKWEEFEKDLSCFEWKGISDLAMRWNLKGIFEIEIELLWHLDFSRFIFLNTEKNSLLVKNSLR